MVWTRIKTIWKAVNMIDLSDSEAAIISSEVKQASFETNDNLRSVEKEEAVVVPAPESRTSALKI